MSGHIIDLLLSNVSTDKLSQSSQLLSVWLHLIVFNTDCSVLPCVTLKMNSSFTKGMIGNIVMQWDISNAFSRPSLTSACHLEEARYS